MQYACWSRQVRVGALSDVPGSLRHERTGDCDWSLERIDSSRFEHRMELHLLTLRPSLCSTLFYTLFYPTLLLYTTSLVLYYLACFVLPYLFLLPSLFTLPYLLALSNYSTLLPSFNFLIFFFRLLYLITTLPTFPLFFFSFTLYFSSPL